MIRPGDIAMFGSSQYRVAMVWPERDRAIIYGLRSDTSALVRLHELVHLDNHSRRAS